MIIVNECAVIGDHLVVEATVDNLEFYQDIEIGSIIVDTDETFLETGPSSGPLYAKEFDTYYDYVKEHSSTETTEEEETEEVDEDTEDTEETTEETEATEAKQAPPIDRPKIRKHIRISISKKELGLATLSENLFFVYIGAVGVPSPITPCSMDNTYTVAVALDIRSIYNAAVQHIKEVDSCDIPRSLIDYVLRIKVLELAIKTGNYTGAIKQWNKLFRDRVKISSVSNCGCNGY